MIEISLFTAVGTSGGCERQEPGPGRQEPVPAVVIREPEYIGDRIAVDAVRFDRVIDYPEDGIV
jgi:hypothetical protein